MWVFCGQQRIFRLWKTPPEKWCSVRHEDCNAGSFCHKIVSISACQNPWSHFPDPKIISMHNFKGFIKSSILLMLIHFVMCLEWFSLLSCLYCVANECWLIRDRIYNCIGLCICILMCSLSVLSKRLSNIGMRNKRNKSATTVQCTSQDPCLHQVTAINIKHLTFPQNNTVYS